MSYQNPHQMQCTWYDLTEKYGAPNIKWCEQTLCQFISEPANTWSNLGFLMVGILIYVYATKNKHPALIHAPMAVASAKPGAPNGRNKASFKATFMAMPRQAA